MMPRRFGEILFLLGLVLWVPVGFVWAQTEEPAPDEEAPPIPQVHTVQEGENLTIIAQNYGVTVAELVAVNNLAEDAILAVGETLVIPGGEGEAIATAYTVQAGDTLANVAAVFNTTIPQLMDANRLIHPYYQLAAGQTVSVVSRTGSALPQPVTGTPHIVSRGETLLTVAARYNLAPAALVAANDLPFPTYLYPGQRLRIPGQETYRFLPGEWVEVAVRPLPIVQGSTVSIYVENLLDGRPSGQFAGQPLQFTAHQEGFAALVGLDAFTEPGLYTLELSGSGSQPWRPFRQELRVQAGNYLTQSITVPAEKSHLLAPEIRQNEDALLSTIYGRYTEPQQWQGLFQIPVTNTYVSAQYGDGRSYNGGPIEIFHTGVDFGGNIGTSILAPANGTVVFDDLLELRGHTVIIDHGLGVMTAYFHLSESFVEVGDSVTGGEVVAAGGNTGLSTGPHLHWELRVLDVAVNPLQWTNEIFP